MSDEGRIRIVLEGNEEDLSRALKQAARDMGGFNREVDKTGASSRKTSKDVDGLHSSAVKLKGGVSGLNQEVLLLKNAIGTLKLPAIAAGAGVAAQGITQLAAGVIGLTANLRELVPLTAVGVQGMTALGQAMVTAKLATLGIQDAVKAGAAAQKGGAAELKKYQESLKGLSGEQKDFVRVLLDNTDALDKMKKAASSGLLPGLGKGITEARGSLEEFDTVLRATGESMGRVADMAGRFVGREGPDLQKIGLSNAKVIEDLGAAGISLAGALTQVLVAARPVTEELAHGARHIADLVEKWAKAKNESGELTANMQRSKDVLYQWGRVAENLVGVLGNVLDAAQPLGDTLLNDLEKVTARWKEWTEGPGKEEMRRFFDESLPAIRELAGLAGDLAAAFVRIGSGAQLTPIVRVLRTELLPVLEELISGAAETFGPALVDALVQVARLMAQLMAPTGPLTQFVTLVGDAAGLMADLLEQSELVRDVVFGLIAFKSFHALLAGAVAMSASLAGNLRKAAGAGAVAGAAGSGTAAASTASRAAQAVPIVGAAAIVAIGAIEQQKKNAATDAAKAADKARASWERYAQGGPEFAAKWKAIHGMLTELNSDGVLSAGSAREVAREFEQFGVKGKKGIEEVKKASDDFLPRFEAVQKLAKEGITISLDNDQAIKGADQVVTAIERMRGSTQDSLSSMRTNVALNMRLIKKTFGDGSAEAREAISANFGAAVEAVKTMMATHVLTHKKGMEEINRLLRKNLQDNWDMTPKQASRYLHGQDTLTGKSTNSGKAGAQRGGTFDHLPGSPSGDSIPILAAPGEDMAIFTRHQRAITDDALQQAGFDGLPGLMRDVNRPHVGAMGFARGGVVRAARGLQPAVSSLANQLVSKFGLSITSTTGGTHAKNSYHPKGLAADLGGDSGSMLQAADWLKSSGAYRSLLEGIHNPNLSVKNGAMVPSGFWGASTWAGHLNHIHIALQKLGAIAGGQGGIGGATSIKVPKWTGAGGIAGSTGAVSLVAAGAGANALIAAAASASGGGVGAETGAGMVGGPWETTLARIAKQKGWSASDWRWIVSHESGGNVNAKNPTSTAFGLGQLLDSTYKKYGGGPGSSEAEQIAAMARYIADQYGNPTRAKAFWQAHHWYGRGGLIRAARGVSTGGGVGAKRGPRLPRHPPKHKKTAGGMLPATGGAGALVPAEGWLKAVSAQASDAEDTYSDRDAVFSVSEEQPTRSMTLPVPDDQLLIGVLDAGEAAWLQSANKAARDSGQSMDVEVRNEPGIATHIGELASLRGLKIEILGLLGQEQALAVQAQKELTQQLKIRQKLLEQIRDTIQENVEKIQAAKARIHENTHKLKVAQAHLSTERGRHKPDRGKVRALVAQVSALEHAIRVDEHLVTRVTAAGSDLDQRESKTASEVEAFQGDFLNMGDLVKQLGHQTLRTRDVDIATLDQEIVGWGGTAPPRPSLPAAAAVDTSAIDALKDEQIGELRRALALSSTQASALRVFAPMVGSFAHGVDRVDRSGLALVHADETISPDPQGPYGPNRAAAAAMSSTATAGAGSTEVHIYGKGLDALIERVEVRASARAQRDVARQIRSSGVR